MLKNNEKLTEVLNDLECGLLNSEKAKEEILALENKISFFMKFAKRKVRINYIIVLLRFIFYLNCVLISSYFFYILILRVN